MRARAAVTEAASFSSAPPTRSTGVLGPTTAAVDPGRDESWSDMLAGSCSEREFDFERGAGRGVAVLRVQDGVATYVAGDAANEKQRIADFALEQCRRVRIGDL